MDLTQFVNKTYLKADDLELAKIWKIEEIRQEQDEEGKPYVILDLKFNTVEKALQLNQTNLKKLIDLFGSNSDTMKGSMLILKVVETEFKGKPTPGIRIDEAETRKHNGL